MFIGHYGVSLAIKQQRPEIPVWLLFIAVQFLDVLFCLFVLMGVEKMRIVPGFTAYNSYDLFYMPFTHSLMGSFLWATVFGTCTAFALRSRISSRKILTAWLAFAIFSHFLLDLPMHVHDMPLTFTSETKLGFGLWNHKYLSLFAECFAFVGGLLYFRTTRNTKYWVFVLVSLALLIATPFLPDPRGAEEFAWGALAAYFVFSGFAAWAFSAPKRLQT